MEIEEFYYWLPESYEDPVGPFDSIHEAQKASQNDNSLKGDNDEVKIFKVVAEGVRSNKLVWSMK